MQMIQLHIDPAIQDDSRDLLRDIVIGSYPHVLVSEKSDLGADIWEIGPGETPAAYQNELNTLETCLSRGGYAVQRGETSWHISER